MAYLLRNGRSPFWWLQWKNPATGQTERLSTECRMGVAADDTRAVQMKHEYALKELAAVPARHHPFSAWVTDYLEVSHANSPKTLQRYLSNWRLIAAYLDTKKISAPNQVTREICLGYVNWRKSVPHLNGRKEICRNTALLELKVLSKILNEAVVREYIRFNPCVRLKLKRDPSRPKDEMTDRQVATIQQEIKRLADKATTPEEKRNAEFLRVSFEIGRLQGIRLNETWIHMNDIDFRNRTLRVHGKGRKVEEVPINPNLLPLLRKLKSSGVTHTYERPRMPELNWFDFFDKLRAKHRGFENISFHSTRVTFISRMERAGVPEAVMMKTVLHSSVTVHRVYRKVKHAELEPYWKAAGRAA